LNPLKDRVAIVGVSHIGCAKDSGMSSRQMALQAIREAVADAGLRLGDIDGLYSTGRSTADVSAQELSGQHGFLDPIASGLGLQTLTWSAYANQPMLAIQEPALAIASGLCTYLVSFRVLKRVTGGAHYAGPVPVAGPVGHLRAAGPHAFTAPYGYNLVVQHAASTYQRYMHEYGSTAEQLGAYVTQARENALLNEKAVWKQPLAMADYLHSRMISTPLRLFDCDMDVDAAAALVLTSAERATDLPQKPVYIGAIQVGPGTYDPVYFCRRSESASRWLEIWDKADLRPSDMDFAQLYDGFAPLLFYWLEDLGIVKRGEAGPFIASGATALDGSLPASTFGGALGEGRMEGFNVYVEGALQLQGRAGRRQVKNARAGVIASGTATLNPMPGAAILHN
jgi:acetyl-CoA acetyltransferase